MHMGKKKTGKHQKKANELSIGMYDPLKLKVRRAGAVIIDWYVASVLAAIPVTFWLRGGENIHAGSFELSTYGMEKGLIFAGIVFVLAFLYYVAVPCFIWQGQTLGKKICGIRVIRMDGNEVSLWDMIKREVIGAGIVEGGFSVIGTYLRQLLPLFGFVSLFTPVKYLSYIVTVASMIVAMFDKKSRAIHDKIGSTVVVRAL